MVKDRDNGGKFLKGNKVAQKPILCPYCQKELEVKGYYQLKKKNQN